MIKKIFGTVVGAVVLTVAGKMVSDFAETKPSLKNVKDKLKKTGKDFKADCKDVLLQGVCLPVNFQQKTPWSKKFKIFLKDFVILNLLF